MIETETRWQDMTMRSAVFMAEYTLPVYASYSDHPRFRNDECREPDSFYTSRQYYPDTVHFGVMPVSTYSAGAGAEQIEAPFAERPLRLQHHRLNESGHFIAD
jgi:hypothetical protein